MEQFLQAAADWYVISVIGVCSVIAMVLKSVTAVLTTSSRERSRREIAAYIAAGSISPDHGERLMRVEIDSANRAVC